jgi:serine/threonine protein kinase
MIENSSQNMKALSYYICCELFTETIECVHYLQGRNVIHRDLKPANILITNGINGRFVKLADFGLWLNHELNDRSQLTFWEHSNKWHQKLRQPQNII